MITATFSYRIVISVFLLLLVIGTLIDYFTDMGDSKSE